MEARALLCRAPHTYLIIKSHADSECPWSFPGGRIGPRTAAEDALRRLCLELVGVAPDTLIRQPPFEYRFGTHTVTYRYFLCPVARDDALPCGCAELRWTPIAQLSDYVFDAPSEQIVARLQAAKYDR